MAKIGILVASPKKSAKNIGDYIQSLVITIFREKIDEIIEREDLKHFKPKEYTDGEDRVKVLMNAWFMWEPQNWPPSQYIDPLFVSIHISPLVANVMLNQEGIKYLKNYEPIGCRDKGTFELLRKAGINSFFSGCCTLMLGRKYHFTGHRENTYFVDPYIPNPIYHSNGIKRFYWFLRIIIYIIRNFQFVNTLAKKEFFKHFSLSGRYFDRGSIINSIAGYFNSAMFLRVYRLKFTDEFLLSSNYLSHIYQSKPERDNAYYLSESDRLLRIYSSAKMVITSRIHAALPCIGMNTPLLFVIHEDLESKGMKYNTPGRFEGLIDFFRIIKISDSSIASDEYLSEFNKISSSLQINNKTSWIPYEEKLFSICSNFFNKNI